MSIGDAFLITCKQFFFAKITPSKGDEKSSPGYGQLVSIAVEYFKANRYYEFAGFFQESQYFISLWAAHLMLEYGHPPNDLKIAAVNVIKDYSDNPLAEDVAQEEKLWLHSNLHKYI